MGAPWGQGRRQQFIPELLEVHFEELAYLAGRRRLAMDSAHVLPQEIAELGERIRAHVEGLCVAGEALADFMTPRLVAPSRDEAFAAAHALLHSGHARALASVGQAFSSASGEALKGYAQALGSVPRERPLGFLQPIFLDGDSAHGAAAAAALAMRGELDPASPRLAAFLLDGDPGVAELAWRVVPLVDGLAPETTITRPFPDAIRSGPPTVREAAMAAAAWRGEAWLEVVASRLAQAGDALGLRWWAAIGGPDSAAGFGEALETLPPGPQPCVLAGRFGHPSLFPRLIDWMASPNPLVAEAAGLAFTRLTGQDVEGQRVQTEAPPGADEFDAAFAPEVWLPDVRRARDVLAKGDWSSGSRWCRGYDLGVSFLSAAQRAVDMQGRWDFGQRASLAGGRPFAPPVLF